MCVGWCWWLFAAIVVLFPVGFAFLFNPFLDGFIIAAVIIVNLQLWEEVRQARQGLQRLAVFQIQRDEVDQLSH